MAYFWGQVEKAVINYQNSPTKVYGPQKFHLPMCFCIIKMKHIMSSLDFSKTSPIYLRISILACFSVVTPAKGSGMTPSSRSER